MKDYNIPKPVDMVAHRWKDADGVTHSVYTEEYEQAVADRKVMQADNGKRYVTDSWHRDHAYTKGYIQGWRGYIMESHMYRDGWPENREAYERGYEDGKGDRKFALLD